MTRWWLAVVLLGVCGCLTGTEVVVTDTLTFAPTSCDTSLSLSVTNTSGRQRRLGTMRRISGEPIRALPFLDEAGPAFELVPMTVLAPAERTLIPVTFRPRRAGFVESVVEFVFDDQLLTVRLTAEGREGSGLPTRVDFGVAMVGGSVQRQLDATISFVSSTSSVFTGSSREGVVLFRPVRAGQFAGTATVLGPCGPVTLPLTGRAVDALVWAEPRELDFGPTPLRTTSTRTVTFRNATDGPVALTELRAWEGSVSTDRFSVVEPAGGVLLIPAARAEDGGTVPGAATLDVRFTPLEAGGRLGEVRGLVALDTQPTVRAALHGLGGGPDIEVSPTSLELDAAGPLERATLTIRNVGTMSTDPRLALNLGPMGLGPPLFEVVTVTGTGTVTVNAAAYNPTTGLRAGRSVDFEVTAGPSPAVHHLRVFSNDPDEPVVVVVITTR
jgi:hypothetical protein